MTEPLFRNVYWLAAKLARWLLHSAIFGPHDKTVQDLTEARCTAKIRRLVEPIEPPVDSKYKEEIALAEYLETSTFRHQDDSSEREFITVGTFRQRAREYICSKGVSRALGLYRIFTCLGLYEETDSRGGATASLSSP